MRPPGQPPGRRERWGHWPQRVHRRRPRIGRQCRRWRLRRRSFGRLRRPSEAAAEQQQKVQQRRPWACKGAGGGLGGGPNMYAASEARVAPEGVAGARRERSRRSRSFRMHASCWAPGDRLFSSCVCICVWGSGVALHSFFNHNTPATPRHTVSSCRAGRARGGRAPPGPPPAPGIRHLVRPRGHPAPFTSVFFSSCRVSLIFTRYIQGGAALCSPIACPSGTGHATGGAASSGNREGNTDKHTRSG